LSFIADYAINKSMDIKTEQKKLAQAF